MNIEHRTIEWEIRLGYTFFKNICFRWNVHFFIWLNKLYSIYVLSWTSVEFCRWNNRCHRNPQTNAIISTCHCIKSAYSLSKISKKNLRTFSDFCDVLSTEFRWNDLIFLSGIDYAIWMLILHYSLSAPKICSVQNKISESFDFKFYLVFESWLFIIVFESWLFDFSNSARLYIDFTFEVPAEIRSICDSVPNKDVHHFPSIVSSFMAVFLWFSKRY